MNHQKPMTRDQLHEIAARRRGDEDVRALLLEIKRLRELTVAAFQRGNRALRYTEDANAAEAQERFAARNGVRVTLSACENLTLIII